MPTRPRRRLPGWMAVVGVLVLGLVASGCSSAAGGGVVELRYLQLKPEVIGYVNGMIAKFEAENPNIRVVQDNNEGGFVPSLLRNRPPDVMSGNWGYDSGDLSRRGVYTDLSDLPVARQIDPAMIRLVREWGQSPPDAVTALPYSLTAAGVIYNKDIFAKFGVGVPTTWDEFVAACNKFRAAGVPPIYGTYRTNWTVAQGMFDYAVGGTLDTSKFFHDLAAEGTTIDAASPVSFSKTLGPVLPVLDFLREQAQPNASGQDYNAGNTAFANGAAAMYLQGPWALSELAKANPKVNVGTFPLPVTNDPADTKVRVNVDLAFSIPVGGAHPAEVEKFLEFMFRPDNIGAFNQDNAAYSTLLGAAPPTDARLAGLAPYVQARHIYQGAWKYPPAAVAIETTLQTYALNGDGPAALAKLDVDWARVMQRFAVRKVTPGEYTS